MKEFVEYGNYKIYQDGTVIREENGEKTKIEPYYMRGSCYVNLSYTDENGTRHAHSVVLTRFMYQLFHEETITLKDLIIFADGNRNNIHIDNLRKVSRKEYYDKVPNNRKLKRAFSDEACEKIKAEYRDNGRNVNQYVKEGLSIRELATKYDCAPKTITKILRGEYKE